MSTTVEVYNTTIKIPEPPSEIDGCDLPKAEQMWRRKELPEYFETVEYNKSGDLILTPKQEEYAREEVRRCKEGYWIMVNGVATFLPPKYYFYLQWWKLEDDIYPHYRSSDRKYYLFLHHWEKIEWNLGVIRSKRRREGATSQATANLIYECIFYKNSKCGLISKTKDDSKAAFTDMVAFGYKQLPVFLKPKQVNKEDSVTELVFAHKSQNTKDGQASAIKDDAGHQSRVNYKAPVLNAYDSGRVSRIVLDEGGKYPKETPVSQLVSIVSKTLVKGVKRVGYIEMPSTLNSLTKGTGGEFKKVWDNANQFKYKPTINRLVRYFTPAFDGFDGFIDMYGESVMGTPTPEQYEYLVSKWVKRDEDGELISELSEEDIKMGSRYYVQVKRRIGLEGDALEEEIRMNPCNEEEAFLSTVSDCVFDSLAIKKRQKELEESPVHKRRIRYYRNLDGKVSFKDVDEKNKFHWEITQFPPKGEENKYIEEGGMRKPGRCDDGAISVDSYSNSQGGRKYGSKACAWMGRKYDILNPDLTGKPTGRLYGRPEEKDDLHEQVLLAAEYNGYAVYYEHTADDYFGFFKERGRLLYLGLYPLSLIEPDKRGKTERFRGTPLTPFSLTKQLDNGIRFFKYHCDKIDWVSLLDNALIFDAYDRTSYDEVVSFLILISVLMEPFVNPAPPPTPLIKTYPAIANSQNN
jgi:hypothetical protein